MNTPAFFHGRIFTDFFFVSRLLVMNEFKSFFLYEEIRGLELVLTQKKIEVRNFLDSTMKLVWLNFNIGADKVFSIFFCYPSKTNG